MQFPAALPELRRRDAEHRMEGPRESLVRLVAGVQGHLGDWPVEILQLLRRALQPQAPDVLLDVLAHHAAEDAVKVIGRERRDSGQLFEGQRVVPSKATPWHVL